MKSAVKGFLAGCVVCTIAVAPGAFAVQEEKTKDQQKNQTAPQKEQEEQALKLGTAIVTVPFSVTDKSNRYINDLSKEDMEISEDGKPQQVFSFERQTDLPLTMALVVDVSISEEFTLPLERAAAQKFIRRVLRPSKDIAAVVTFERDSVVLQDLTGNVEKINSALDELRVTTPAATVTGPTPPINNSKAGSTAMYDSIYAVTSEMLSHEAGRRVVILITDGHDTSSSVNMKAAIDRAWRHEIIVYSIGIGDPAYGGVNKGVLKRICEDTGGRAYFPRKEEELDEAFAQIDEDLRSQYLLSYSPTNAAPDGSFRTIQLRVKNRKELTVRHRRGYFAPKELQ